MHRLRRLLRNRPGATLAVYWVAAFVITHVPPILPKDEEPRFDPPVGPDKLVHFVGFAMLAFLLMNVFRSRRGIAWTLLVCVTYGIVDELTQPTFGRTADVWDYVADLIGAVAGVAVFHGWTRRSVSRGTAT
jgi:VanZ family protein